VDVGGAAAAGRAHLLGRKHLAGRAAARHAGLGLAEVVTDPQALTRMLALENAKYSTDYSIELAEGDFTGSPTRWVFDAG
jgi:hypothetical protein